MVVCLVAWPLNESEARGDVILIETSLVIKIIGKFLAQDNDFPAF